MKKILIVFVVIIAMNMCFAGCSKEEPANEVNETPVSDDSKEVAEDEKSDDKSDDKTDEKSNEKSDEESEEKSEEKAVLTFWKWIPQDQDNQWYAMEKDFEEKYPNIDIQATQVANANEYFQKISAALIGGEGPDILAMQPSNAVQYKEFLEPLESYAVEAWGDNYRNLFVGAAMEQCEYSGAGDELVILPGGMTGVSVLFYNHTMFEKYGFDVPQTLDEVKALNERIAKEAPDVIPGLFLGAKDGWVTRDMFMTVVNQVAPGKVYEAIEGEIPWTNPDIVEAFEVWENLFVDGDFFQNGPLGYAMYPTIHKEFYMPEKAAMVSTGTWQLSVLTSASTKKFVEEQNMWSYDNHSAMALFPKVTEDAEQNLQVTVDVSWGINKDCENKEAAWTFLEYLTQGEGAQIFANSFQVLPAVQGMTIDPAGLYGEAEAASLEIVVEALENSVVGAREIRYPELQTEVINSLQAVAGGAMTPKEACEAIEKKSQTIDR